MSQVIHAIYENGVFKPLGKVALKEHEHIRLIIADLITDSPVREYSLSGIIDIAPECADTDLSIHHDKYLYGEVKA